MSMSKHLGSATRLLGLVLLLGVAALSAAEPGNATLVSQTVDSVPLSSGADRVLPLTYALINRGTAMLTVSTPVTIAAASNRTVLTTTQPAGSFVADTSGTLALVFTPGAVVPWSFAVSMSDSDADESPYSWIVSGEPAPVLRRSR